MENFTVRLQDPAHYSAVWVILAAVFFLCAIALFALAFIKKRPPEIKRTQQSKKAEGDDRRSWGQIQEEYLKKLNKLRQQAENQQITERELCQQLSTIMRDFFDCVLDSEAKYCTLTELQEHKNQMSKLIEVIEKCYEPEFAEIPRQTDYLQILKTAEDTIRNRQAWK